MLKYLFLLILTASTLCAEVKVLAFAGSTRKDSCNKKLVAEAARFAEQCGATVTLIDLKNFPMPLYDADFENDYGMPENAKGFRQLIMDNDLIIIASPDYNHSLSGVLKNALDWASRTEDGERARHPFAGKEFLLLSASPGKKGGASGLVHLREVLSDLKGTVVTQEFSLSDAYNAFTLENTLNKPETAAALRQVVQKALEK